MKMKFMLLDINNMQLYALIEILHLTIFVVVTFLGVMNS